MKNLKDFLSQQKPKTKVSQTEETIIVPEVLPVLDSVDEFLFMGEEQDHSKPMDPPAVLIMRRKQIRSFPGGQRVALYYVDKINKYITVPYSDMQWSASVKEELTPFEKLEIIKENNSIETLTFDDGTKMTIKPQVADAMLELYNKLNYENRKRFVDSVNESKESFKNLSKFALEN